MDALEQMSSYVMFLKDILANKRKITGLETMALIEITNNICNIRTPAKMTDPGSFTVPSLIGGINLGRTLCELGASINLMPLSIFKKWKIGEIQPTLIRLNFEDRSIAKPEGNIEDVLVKVDKFMFPTNFIILDYEADREVPIILGRPLFLATCHTLIDVHQGEMTMCINREEVKFNVINAMKFTTHVKSWSALKDLD